MRVSINWLKELVDLKVPMGELVRLLPARTVGLKEATDDYIELDMKGYNRADLLSMRGVAYEVAAITDSKIKFQEEKPILQQIENVKVEVEDINLCPVYCVAKIENLKVENSSDTWVKKLNNSGIRAVNSVADVTNLIMLEYGQPMHAFDASQVRGSVRVRVAGENEKITTLDGKVRNLNEEDLLITDENGPIGIAGVMGGKDSEVSETTTAILLEAAIFDPISIRKTATRLNLPSEASKRFQHGLTKKRLLQALDTAIKMYESLGGKLTAITLTGNLEDEIKTIKLTQKKVNSLMGVDISPEDIESSLKKLGFLWNNWEVVVPYWRLDINIEEDLIEEVARMYGYEKILPKELSNKLPDKIDQTFFELITKLKTKLVNLGLAEVQTYSFYSTKVLNNLRLNTEDLIKIANPMSAETEYLRDNLWPNLLEITAKNIRQGYKDITIFEIGKVYSPQKGDSTQESYHLSIALSNGTDNPLAELNHIFSQVHLGGGFVATPREFSHPTRHTNGMAEIHPRFVNKFGIEQRVAILEKNFIFS